MIALKVVPPVAVPVGPTAVPVPHEPAPNVPATWGTDGKLIATPSWGDNGVALTFASGAATAGGASTLTNSSKTWTVNQWANSQIRITVGTGIGQIRSIVSNTATVITTSAPWTTAPDATSQYVIEGNDNFIYAMGNAAVALYRYDITANTWSTLTPTAARAAAPSVGMSGHWIYGVTDDARWTNENDIINGRRIYSFRGGGSAALDYYDIGLNTWVSTISYAPGIETFTTGTKYVYAGNYLYIQKEATGRWFRYSFAEQGMVGWSTNINFTGAAIAGDTAFDLVYEIQPGSFVRFVYMVLNSSTIHMRCMVI